MQRYNWKKKNTQAHITYYTKVKSLLTNDIELIEKKVSE